MNLDIFALHACVSSCFFAAYKIIFNKYIIKIYNICLVCIYAPISVGTAGATAEWEVGTQKLDYCPVGNHKKDKQNKVKK